MLLDPFEKQLDLPSAAVKIADGFGRYLEVVGQKDQSLSGLRVFQSNSSERAGVALSRVEPGQGNLLIANQPKGLVDRLRSHPFVLQRLLGPRDKKRTGLVDRKQSLEIDIGAIHHVERTRLGPEQVQDVDIVQQAVGDQHKRWDCASEIEQSMDFDRSLRFPEVGPWEQRQTQADGGGIERVDSPVQIQSEIVVGIQAAGDSDQRLGKLGIDAPIPSLVRIGKVGASDVATQTHVVKLGRLRLKASGDIPQALPKSQLRESHAQKLVPTSERSGVEVSVVLADQPSKGMPGRQLHQLGENQLSRVHPLPSGKSGKRGASGCWSSSR